MEVLLCRQKRTRTANREIADVENAAGVVDGAGEGAAKVDLASIELGGINWTGFDGDGDGGEGEDDEGKQAHGDGVGMHFEWFGIWKFRRNLKIVRLLWFGVLCVGRLL